MSQPPRIDIAAQKRVPFDDTISIMWQDYSDATPLMHVRTEPGDGGTPLISLGPSSEGGEGIELTYDPAFVDPDGGDPGATIVRIIIDEATLEGLDYGADPASPVELHYDIHLTPASGKKFVFCGGRFVIHPGVTR